MEGSPGSGFEGFRVSEISGFYCRAGFSVRAFQSPLHLASAFGLRALGCNS